MLSLAQTPPSQTATLTGSPWPSPAHHDQTPCSPLAIPSPTGQHVRPVSSGEIHHQLLRRKAKRLPNSAAPGS